MSQIVELLNKSSQLEKVAYSEYVKSLTASAISSLTQSGYEFEKAASIVRSACEGADEIVNRSLNYQIFEKAAQYISELEVKVDELEKVAYQVEVSEDKKEPLNKLAGMGFSEEEMEALSHVDSNLLTKVANVVSSPVSMGGGSGFAREKTDPLLEFLVS